MYLVLLQTIFLPFNLVFFYWKVCINQILIIIAGFTLIFFYLTQCSLKKLLIIYFLINHQ